MRNASAHKVPKVDSAARRAALEAAARSCDIEQLPPGAVVLASNDMGLQALELRHGPGTFWGVQYHPEYSFAEIAAAALRYGSALIAEQLFADRAELDLYVAELRALMHDPHDARLTWKHGLGRALRASSALETANRETSQERWR